MKKVEQEDLPSLYAAMTRKAREALIREEVQLYQRLQTSLLSNEQLLRLVKEDVAPSEYRMTGD